MASNQTSNPENEDEQLIKREKKEIEELIVKQEARLSQLLSNGFQLANFYFVFQGVILTALCNRETALKCSDRWFLATLSALAAAVNLFALVLIGAKYIRVYTQQAIYVAKGNQKQADLRNRQDQQRKPKDEPVVNIDTSEISQQPKDEPVVTIDTSEISQQLEPKDEPVVTIDTSEISQQLKPKVEPKDEPKDEPVVNIDTSEIRIRWVCFYICIISFLSFATIVFVGCLRFLCRDSEGTKK